MAAAVESRVGLEHPPQFPRWQRVCGGSMMWAYPRNEVAAVPAMAESLWRTVGIPTVDTRSLAAVPAMAESLWRIRDICNRPGIVGRSSRDGREFVAGQARAAKPNQHHAAVPAMAESLWRTIESFHGAV